MNRNNIYDYDQIRELHSKGLTDKEISEIIGAKPNAFAKVRKRLGLEPNKPRETYELKGKELEILVGTLLGDSCIRYVHEKCKYPSLTFTHCMKQEEWFLWKYKNLNQLLSSYNVYNKTNYWTGDDKKEIQCVGKNMKCLVEIRNIFYKEGVKIIPVDFLKENFTELSLFCLYMDDGSYDKSSNSYIINTQCFSEEDLEKFTNLLKEKFNLSFNIKKDHTLYLKHESNEIFKNILIKFNECNTMDYKIACRLKTPLNEVKPEMVDHRTKPL